MVKINLTGAKNCRDSEIFIKKFLIKNRSKKLIKYVFFNLVEDRINYLNNLTNDQLIKHRCLIFEAAKRGQIEILDFFLSKMSNIDFNSFEICDIETLEFLEKRKMVKAKKYPDILIDALSNNLTDLSEYLIKNHPYSYVGRYFAVTFQFNYKKFNEDTFKILFDYKVLESLSFNIKMTIIDENLIRMFFIYGLGHFLSLESFENNVELLEQYQHDFRFIDVNRQNVKNKLLCLAAFDNYCCEVADLLVCIKSVPKQYLDKLLPKILLKYSEYDRNIITNFIRLM